MSQHPYPVRVSADGEVAVQVGVDPEYPNYGPWRSTSGASLSDKQVADWTPYAPTPQLNTEGGAANQIAHVLDGAVESGDITDADTARALRDAIMHLLRMKGYIREGDAQPNTAAAIYAVERFADRFAIDHSKHDQIIDTSHGRRLLLDDLDLVIRAASETAPPVNLPGMSAFVHALAEWTTHYPPKVGNDVDLSSTVARLDDLTPEQLEILALAAGSLKDRAWDVRREKITEAERAKMGITWAYVNVSPTGQLLFDDPGVDGKATISIVTVGEHSTPVPGRVENGGIIAGARLTHALRTLGYLPVDLSDGKLDDGVLSFLVRRVPAGE